MEMYLIAGLISVVDPFLRHHFGGEKVGKFAEIDAVPQTLLQLGGWGQVLLQTGLYPPKNTQILISKKAEDFQNHLYGVKLNVLIIRPAYTSKS